MLTLWGNQDRHAAPVSRRSFLQVGALGLGGLGLADILRLQAQAQTRAAGTQKPRAVIMVCLGGGPSHIDMYDLKPEAPSEFRGEFRPIKTNVPGFDICEHLPLQAKIADKLALVRNLQFVEPMQHELEEVYTGFPKSAMRPTFGSVVSRFRGGDRSVPPYVSLEYSAGFTSYEHPRYVGAAHAPLHIAGGDGVHNLGPMNGMAPGRMVDRRSLLKQFDAFNRNLDASREGQNLDAYTSRAFDIIASPKVRDAFDLSQEPLAVRNRYFEKDEKFTYVGREPDSFWYGEKFLQARRLVEAGVPVVTMRVGLWDHHGNVIQASNGVSIWHSLRNTLPLLDRSVSALVADLHERGLDKEVMVLVWGEFGRTPRISLAGRDHWPEASFALFAGAVRSGQVIGETDSHAERPTGHRYGPQNVLGTIYHALGIDWRQQINDFGGRPMQLLDDGRPIAELI